MKLHGWASFCFVSIVIGGGKRNMPPYADRERQKAYMRDYAQKKRQEFKFSV